MTPLSALREALTQIVNEVDEYARVAHRCGLGAYEACANVRKIAKRQLKALASVGAERLGSDVDGKKPMKLRFSNDWLKNRIASDPDLDVEAGLPPPALASSPLPSSERVRKTSGYKFEGVIVAHFKTVAGKERCVVDNGDGLLHIFNPEQLERIKK